MFNKSTICRTANTLIKEGHSWSEAFRLAWQLGGDGLNYGMRLRLAV
jgi:hypothetical protein